MKKILAILLSGVMLLGCVAVSTAAEGVVKTPYSSMEGEHKWDTPNGAVDVIFWANAKFDRITSELWDGSSDYSSTVSLYKWDTDIDTSVAGTPVQTWSINTANGNTDFTLDTPAEAGKYLVRFAAGGEVGISVAHRRNCTDLMALTYVGGNRARVDQCADFALRFTETPADGNYFLKLTEEDLLGSNVAVVAASIKSLEVDYMSEMLVLPKFDGVTVEVFSSSDESLITKNGAVDIARSGSADIVLKLTDSNGKTANTSPITVNVISCMLEIGKISNVTASSSHEAWPPAHLINGDKTNGFWSNGDNAALEVEIVAELEKAGYIEGVALYPRYVAGNNYFPSDFEIFVSEDNEAWTSVKKVSGYSVANYQEAQNFYFEKAENARYFKIVMNRGDSAYVQFAEIEVFVRREEQSLDDALPALVVKQIDDRIVFDGISKQFKVEISSATPENIVDKNSNITLPDKNTEVTLTLTVTNRLNTEDQKEITQKVIIKNMNTLSVEKIANEINLIPCPSNNATQITLPEVPAGYTIAIAESSHPDVVDTTGKITRSDDTTYGVRLTFEITSTETGASALTDSLLVPIYKTYVKPSMSQEEIDRIHEEYEAKSYGVFVHYISEFNGYSCVYPDGTVVNTVDELAEAFDAAAFAKSMHEFGVEYVVLTCWHGDTRTLFPSMTNQRWRDDRRGEDSIGKKTYSDRDVIADLLDELDKYGIDLHLYTHPTDGHDFTAEDQLLVGQNDNAGEYAVWNQYINELYYEVCERYGDRIKGLWFDGVFGHTSGEKNQQRLRETCLSFYPGMILTMNTGFVEGEINPWSHFTVPDYRCWEVNRTVDFVNDMKFSRHQVAIILGGHSGHVEWWTNHPQTYEFPLQPAEDVFKYLVAISSVSSQGGLLASTGFYPVRDGEDVGGDYFMNGIYDMLKKVNDSYLEPVKESIKNTKNSTAYPTTENLCVKDLEWGVANESEDGKYIYFHVLNAPEGNTLTLSAPADKTELKVEAVIMNFDGTTTALTVEKAGNGYSITLPEGISWNGIDTVIKAERVLNETTDNETTTPDAETTVTPDGETTVPNGETTDTPTGETTVTPDADTTATPADDSTDAPVEGTAGATADETTAAEASGCKASLGAVAATAALITAAGAVVLKKKED